MNKYTLVSWIPGFLLVAGLALPAAATPLPPLEESLVSPGPGDAAKASRKERFFGHAPGDQVIGNESVRYEVEGDETLIELARLFDLGYNELVLANPEIDPWVPRKGDLVRLPSVFVLPPEALSPGLTINLPEIRMYYRHKDHRLETFPVGIGREGFETPVGKATVVRKQANPSWHVPASIRKENPNRPAVVPPGPDNPLGTHALYLSIEGYLIHGTHQPLGVGRRVSHGCMRLYPEDIPILFSRVSPGERVNIVNQPAKAGWLGNLLYLELHPPLREEGTDLAMLATQVVNQARQWRPGATIEVDWRGVEQLVAHPDGIAHPIGKVIDGATHADDALGLQDLHEAVLDDPAASVPLVQP